MEAAGPMAENLKTLGLPTYFDPYDWWSDEEDEEKGNNENGETVREPDERSNVSSAPLFPKKSEKKRGEKGEQPPQNSGQNLLLQSNKNGEKGTGSNKRNLIRRSSAIVGLADSEPTSSSGFDLCAIMRSIRAKAIVRTVVTPAESSEIKRGESKSITIRLPITQESKMWAIANADALTDESEVKFVYGLVISKNSYREALQNLANEYEHADSPTVRKFILEVGNLTKRAKSKLSVLKNEIPEDSSDESVVIESKTEEKPREPTGNREEVDKLKADVTELEKKNKETEDTKREIESAFNQIEKRTEELTPELEQEKKERQKLTDENKRLRQEAIEAAQVLETKCAKKEEKYTKIVKEYSDYVAKAREAVQAKNTVDSKVKEMEQNIEEKDKKLRASTEMIEKMKREKKNEKEVTEEDGKEKDEEIKRLRDMLMLSTEGQESVGSTDDSDGKVSQELRTKLECVNEETERLRKEKETIVKNYESNRKQMKNEHEKSIEDARRRYNDEVRKANDAAARSHLLEMQKDSLSNEVERLKSSNEIKTREYERRASENQTRAHHLEEMLAIARTEKAALAEQKNIANLEVQRIKNTTTTTNGTNQSNNENEETLKKRIIELETKVNETTSRLIDEIGKRSNEIATTNAANQNTDEIEDLLKKRVKELEEKAAEIMSIIPKKEEEIQVLKDKIGEMEKTEVGYHLEIHDLKAQRAALEVERQELVNDNESKNEVMEMEIQDLKLRLEHDQNMNAIEEMTKELEQIRQEKMLMQASAQDWMAQSQIDERKWKRAKEELDEMAIEHAKTLEMMTICEKQATDLKDTIDALQQSANEAQNTQAENHQTRVEAEEQTRKAEEQAKRDEEQIKKATEENSRLKKAYDDAQVENATQREEAEEREKGIDKLKTEITRLRLVVAEKEKTIEKSKHKNDKMAESITMASLEQKPGGKRRKRDFETSESEDGENAGVNAAKNKKREAKTEKTRKEEAIKKLRNQKESNGPGFKAIVRDKKWSFDHQEKLNEEIIETGIPDSLDETLEMLMKYAKEIPQKHGREHVTADDTAVEKQKESTKLGKIADAEREVVEHYRRKVIHMKRTGQEKRMREKIVALLQQSADKHTSLLTTVALTKYAINEMWAKHVFETRREWRRYGKWLANQLMTQTDKPELAILCYVMYGVIGECQGTDQEPLNQYSLKTDGSTTPGLGSATPEEQGSATPGVY